MRFHHLAIVRLQQVGARAVQHAGAAARERRSVLPAVQAQARRLDPEEPHRGLFYEPMKRADRIRSASHACHHGIGEPPEPVGAVNRDLFADDGLQLADEERIWMRARGAADAVVRRADVRDPVTDRLVHRVFQCARARLDGTHLGAE